MKQVLLFILCPLFLFGQTKIGSNLNGENSGDESGSAVSLSSNGNIVAVGAPMNDGNGVDSGHVRIFENQSGTWNQLGIDINGETVGDELGSAVSLSSDGTIVAVGAPMNDGNGVDSGHVRVYQYQTDSWVQLGSDINGEAIGDESGGSINLSSDGTIIAVGAPMNDGNGVDSGHVRVYQYQTDSWVQLGSDIDGEAIGDESGKSVALSSDGTIVVIGSPKNDGNGLDSGLVKKYKFETDSWVQLGSDINGKTTGDEFGSTIGLSSSGFISAIGAPKSDSNGIDSGYTEINNSYYPDWYYNCYPVYDYWGNYIYDDCYWEYYKIQKSKGISSIDLKIDGESLGDEFGSSVSLSSDGNILAIGAVNNDGNGADSGHVRLYNYVDDNWVKIGVDVDGESLGDNFGSSVSLSSDGTIVAIGSPGNNSGFVGVYDLSALLSTESFDGDDFSMSPNPATNQFSIQLPDSLQLKKVSIYNQLGQFIKASIKTTVDVSTLSNGMYFVEVVTNQGKATRKIMVD